MTALRVPQLRSRRSMRKLSDMLRSRNGQISNELTSLSDRPSRYAKARRTGLAPTGCSLTIHPSRSKFSPRACDWRQGAPGPSYGPKPPSQSHRRQRNLHGLWSRSPMPSHQLPRCVQPTPSFRHLCRPLPEWSWPTRADYRDASIAMKRRDIALHGGTTCGPLI